MSATSTSSAVRTSTISGTVFRLNRPGAVKRIFLLGDGDANVGQGDMSRIAAWASPQSAVLESRAELERRYRERDAEFPGEDVPLPPFWGGYRITPLEIEVWADGAFRLHDRFAWRRRDTSEKGHIERLNP